MRQALTAAQQRLAAAGVSSPDVDAKALLLHALGLEQTAFTQLFLLLGDPISEEVRETFEALVEQRVQRIPLQHILGHTSFYGLDLLTQPGAFIPRPETELLVDWARAELARNKQPAQPQRIMDLCTGPGTIALALASLEPSEVGELHITAVDIDPAALALARANEQQLRSQGSLHHPIEWIKADLVGASPAEITNGRRGSGVEQQQADVNLIVSNPPYVPEGDSGYGDPPVEPEVRHDPHHAVFSGKDGMEFMPHLIELATQIAAPTAAIGIEHDDTTGAATATLLDNAGGWSRITTHQDLAGRDRFTTAIRNTQPGTPQAELSAMKN